MSPGGARDADDRTRDADDERALDAYLERVRAAAAWDRSRAEGFERKAGVVLAASGALLALLPNVYGTWEPSGWFESLLAAVVVALSLSAVCNVRALLSYRTAYDALEGVRVPWRDYRDGRKPNPRESNDVKGSTVDAFLSGEGDPPRSWRRPKVDDLAGTGVLQSLKSECHYRSLWTNLGSVFLLAALLLLAVGLLGQIVTGERVA